ncbi:hypothetical protein O4H49_04405 [Kiloniella laminariae]|uniref:Uncharacterized protein n=1 Tax=Kiloniella laminariae TaxID=454162 RepID=A0ABT4LFY6_9PROT|nr:hypothetical protein [Kiloniella laminariae]MCZ4280007.1 hypothetical protein [Kiloniella laminariae]
MTSVKTKAKAVVPVLAAVPGSDPDPDKEAAVVKVRAIKLGYYGVQLRQVGDVFELRDAAHFSTSWMEKI